MSYQAVPLHPAQKDVYIDQLLHPESPHYNIGGYLKITGKLDTKKLRIAANSLPEVFDTLKMRFDLSAADATGYIDEQYCHFELPDLDFDQQTKAFTSLADKKKYIEEWVVAQFKIPFKIEKNKLPAEQYLIKISADEHWFYFKYHHLISDGYGMSAINHYIAGKYKSLVANDGVAFNFTSYREEAVKAAAYHSSDEYKAEGTYWKEKIGSYSRKLLQRKYRQGGISGKEGDSICLKFQGAEREALEKLAASSNANLQQLTIAALIIYYSRISTATTFVFGIPLHRRRNKALRSIGGMFSGIIPFKGKYEPDMKLIDMIRSIASGQRSDYRHQNYLIGDLSRDLNINSAEDTLLEIMINNAPVDFNLDFGDGMQAALHNMYSGSLSLPLELYWFDFGPNQPLELRIDFQQQYFKKEDIDLFSNRLLFILSQFNAHLEDKTECIQLIPQQEKKLLDSFNILKKANSVSTIITEFEYCAALTPDAIALVFDTAVLTYRELNERANQLANYLIKSGVKTDMPVPVCIDRSSEMMISILAILKAGGAYVPIDPGYPEDRILFMLEDINSPLLLTVSGYQKLFALSQQLKTIICIDTIQHIVSIEAIETPVTALMPDNLAYIMYTSGSTGKPKGVMVTHHNVVSLVKDVTYVNLEATNVLLSTGSPSFDAVTFEYWGMLLNGGKLVLSTEETLLDSNLLKQLIRREKVSHMWFTSGWLNQLITIDLTIFDGLSVVLAGGEKLSEKHIAQLAKAYPELKIINGYGPTENTTFSLTYEIPAGLTDSAIPIGRALDYRSAYIFNEQLELLPVGESGEIFVGGAGLSRGYLNLPELTAERFIRHPFSKDPEERLYKTGDLGCWLPDGNIAYLGRIDDQVKIRGYRIELGEIENVLLGHEQISNTVVVARADQSGVKRLIGYVVAENTFNAEEIEDWLKTLLPEYMIPSLWVEMDSLPITPNGKVDRKALPEPKINDRAAAAHYIAPRTETEKILAEIWQELLGIERIGIHEDFFKSGGDSIIAIQLVSRARKAGCELSPKDIFTQQTIAKLAHLTEGNQENKIINLNEQGRLQGKAGLLPIQQWFFENEPADSPALHHFNQSILLKVDKKVDWKSLSFVLEKLQDQHDALRFSYAYNNGEWVQTYNDVQSKLVTADLSAAVITELPELITACCEKYQKSLHITHQDILRMVWIKTPEEETYNRLFLVVHHLAVDGVSWRILVEDMAQLIDGAMKNEKIKLEEKTASYRSWYDYLVKYGELSAVSGQIKYWNKVIHAGRQLAADENYQQVIRVKDTTNYTIRIGKTATQQLLLETSAAYQTEINDILLAALALTLCEWSSKEQVYIGLEGHGREELNEKADISRTVGWFTSLYPVLLSLENCKDNSDVIKSIKEQLRQIPDKGIGYGVLKYLNKEAALEAESTWDLVFNYLGQLDNITHQSEWLSIAAESAGNYLSENSIVNDKIAINGMVQAGELILHWTYSHKHFKESTIRQLAAGYERHLALLTAHCKQQAQIKTIATPSDYGLTGAATYQQLDAFSLRRKEVVTAIYRLSGLQEGMLFDGLYDQASTAYIRQLVCQIGDIDTAVFKQSWLQVINRHSILRSGFNYQDLGVPVQFVCEELTLPFEILDFSSLNEEEQVQAEQEYLVKDRAIGFDYDAPPLMRVTLLRLNEQNYRMVCTFHHLLLDGWSVQVLLEELTQYYELLLEGKEIAGPEQDNYEDYIHFIEGRDKIKEEQYWKTYMDGLETGGGLLPFIKPTAERTKGAGVYEEESLVLDSAISSQLKTYARKHGLTVNTIMQAAWGRILQTYTGSEDITFGVTVSGRPGELHRVEKRVGLYINTLPLHASGSGDTLISDWMNSIQQSQSQSREYEYTALSAIQQWIGSAGDFFDSVLVFENYPVSDIVSSSNWKLKITNGDIKEFSNYPLTIIIMAAEDTRLLFCYNSTLLESVYVRQLALHFEALLLQIISNEQGKLGDLKLVTGQERETLLSLLSGTETAYPKDSNVIEIFEKWAEKTPDAVALEFGDQKYTYRELNEKSNQLGHYLLMKGVGSDQLIGLCTTRSIDMITGILGIWKAGGAYVPIDPEYPEERIVYLLEDSGLKFIVSNTQSYQCLPAFVQDSRTKERKRKGNHKKLILLDENELLVQQPLTSPANTVTGQDLSYVIYTSGSTGKPKGVLVEHRGMLNHLYSKINELEIGQESAVAYIASFTFDISVWQMFCALLTGGRTVIYSSAMIMEPAALIAQVEKDQIDILELVPSYLAAVLQENPEANLEKLRYLLVTGEAVSQSILAQWFAHPKYGHIPVVNAYGPTEASDDITHHFIYNTPESSNVPLGKTIQNLHIYILDAYGQICPLGVPGEICVSGIGVSRGYLNREDLTKEKFITDPFRTGHKLYKTGDLGRALPEGIIEYLGRIDDQVKIRGYRIELGEIEYVLNQYPEITQSIVIAKADTQGSKYLIAYIVASQNADREAITARLKIQLPEYMVPVLVRLDELPLTANGKIDKKALPEPDGVLLSTRVYAAPRNTTERELAAIWQDLLKLEQIGIDDNFFELGGHSLLVMRVIAAIRSKLGVELVVKDVFTHPTIAGLALYIQEKGVQNSLPAITSEPKPTHIPLSFSQERLWFIDRLEGSTHYHLPAALRLKGKLNINALQSALQKIINRHQALRTVMIEEDGVAYQQLLPTDCWQLLKIEKTKDTEDAIAEFIHRPFNISTDHMLRVGLMELSEEENLLIIVMHHIASDGWSSSIVIRELGLFYAASVSGNAAALKPLNVQYTDYAIWQRTHIAGTLLKQQQEYWKKQLSGAEALQLPTDFARPAIQSTAGAVYKFKMDRDLAYGLNQYSQQQGATLFMTLLSAFQVLLYRYSGQEDITVGTLVAGRTQQEVEELVGFFINTLAIRSDLSGEPSFDTLVQQVKTTLLEGYAHQDMPFEKALETVVNNRDLGKNPLFQVMFVLQNTPDMPSFELGDLTIVQETVVYNPALLDLYFTVFEKKEGLLLNIGYCTDLFCEETIARMADHYEQLLRAIVTRPSAQIGKLQMLTNAESDELLAQLSGEETAYPKESNIVALFEQRALKTPDAIATLFAEQSYTYRELNEKANQLAHLLISKGVKTDVLVGFCIGRTLDMITGILGIWKAGGAYVPIDPLYPAERIDYLLNDSGVSLVVSDQQSCPALPAAMRERVILLDKIEFLAGQLITSPENSITSQQLSYVIYTSGSTGKPKGVLVEHGGMLNHLYSKINALNLDQDAVIAYTASYTFDISVWQMFCALLTGGCTVVYPAALILEPAALIAQVEADQINILELVPSYLGAVLQESPAACLKKIRYLLVTGEAVSQSVLTQWFAHPEYGRIPVVNAYGPTEASDDITHHFMYSTPESSNVPLGKTIQNLHIYILDTQGQLCPLGVAGEICVSGVGVSRGYLNREELTREKFIADPFRTGNKLYKTGDLGRSLKGGIIEYLGRIDDQVKIRGYRIELGEIEYVLNQHRAIEQSVVVAKADEQGVKRLVAYIVPSKTVQVKETEPIIAYLKEHLPEYMIPVLINLDHLPLTANGKIDKKALPEPEGELLAGSLYAEPRNETESVLVNIWQELLKAGQIGIHDNFFALGGHSLLVMRMIAAMRKSLSVELAVKDVFTHATIAELSAHMGMQVKKVNLPAITVQPIQINTPLSFSQERLWFIDKLEGSIHYHIPGALRLTGRLNQDTLQYALQTIISRHEALRTVIGENNGIPYQQVLSPDHWELAIIDSSGDPHADIVNFIEQPFDLAADYMLRAGLIQTGADEHLLVISVHHIASDGWSATVMVKELTELYAAYIEGRTVQLEPLPVQYKDYAIWQRTHIKDEILQTQLDYWKGKLSGVETLQLPTDFLRPVIQGTNGAVLYFNIPADLSTELNQLSQERGTTLYTTLLAAFQVLLYRYSSQEDICVGTPVAGRTQQEIEDLVGFFVNTLAIRSKLDGLISFNELLEQLQNTLFEGYEYQDAPFEKVVDAVVKGRDKSMTPLFQVMFVLQNTPDAPELKLGDLKLELENIHLPVAKFDITFTIEERKDGLALAIEYCTDLFLEDTIARMAGHYEQLLRSIVSESSAMISVLPMLTLAESEQLMLQLSGEQTVYPDYSNVIALFEECVIKTPDATALVFEDQRYTYLQLNEKANRLAHYLISQQVKADQLVGLCIGRSADMITGILGIWKAGGAYVPIDPSYPAERVDYLIADSGVQLVISDEQSKGVLPVNMPVILLDNIEFLAQHPDFSPENHIASKDLSYVIYTSGSTGKPKGVLVEHRGMLNHLYAKINALKMDEHSIVAYIASYTFDISVWQMFCALLSGGQTVIYSSDLIMEPAALISQVDTDHVNILELVPSYLAAVLQENPKADLENLNYLMVTGEAVSQSVLAQWFAHPKYGHIPVINAYGPTEASDDITHHLMYSTPENGNVPLGKTVQNLQIYILDGYGQLCPEGVPGEICVSGIGVSRGYLNREELTREKFIADPFRPEHKMYKTGDLGRSLTEGVIEYLGRIDDQVKIRGYRIELGEIEHVLNQHAEVVQSVVIAKSDEQGVKRLVGYIVANLNADREDILAYLKEQLPEYMIPVLVRLDQLPLTANGKIDKKALPEPDGDLLSNQIYVAPRDATEQVLAQIWQDLLQIKQVGIYDDFFDLGGHSLLIMRLASAVLEQFNITISIRNFFDLATIDALAQYINNRQTEESKKRKRVKL